MSGFAERVLEASAAKQTVVCVGLDPRVALLPAGLWGGGAPATAESALEKQAEGVVAFCRQVIDRVAPHAVAVKPQAAFFELLRAPGWAALEAVCDHARQRGLLVVMDVKRGDIGTTAEAYAAAFLRSQGGRPALADACTVNPYLGSEGVRPFADAARETGGGIFVLVKTSNPSSAEIQDLVVSGRPLYAHLADLVRGWNQPVGTSGYGPVGAVVGVTHPAHLAELRARLPTSLLLLPGFGAQGGGPADVVSGFDRHGAGALVTASRSVTYPWVARGKAGSDRWEEEIEQAVISMKREIGAALSARGRGG